jgi:uncharacterized cupin superfamily protein
MRIVLDHRVRKGAVRADRAWRFFCNGKFSLGGGEGLWGFANWLWGELSKEAGSLNRDSKGSLTVSIPALDPPALDFVVRLVSFWATDVRERRGRTVSENLWRAPVVNTLDDGSRKGAEKALVRVFDTDGSTELNLMPLLGPGRAFFSVQAMEIGGETARMHSHSAVDEYYLILDGKGTVRFNGKAVKVEKGDIIAKPTGPDAATHLLANRGERLRILDMEIWHDRFTGSSTTSKDVVYWPDYAEAQLRGPGWAALLPADSLMRTTDLERHWSDKYRRTKEGKRVRTKLPRRTK